MDTPELPDREEQDIASLLQTAGRREQLPAELKQRWEQLFRRELQPVLAQRERRRRRRIGGFVAGLGACAALLVAVVMLDRAAPAASAPALRIAAMAGDVRAIDASGGELTVSADQWLPADSRIHTGAHGFVAMTYNGYEIRLNSHAEMAIGNHNLDLARGTLYASDGPASAITQPLIINTPLGSVRDVGTQFLVEVQPERTVTTVRRGAVILDTGDTQHLVSARPGSASRVIANLDEAVQIETVAPLGDAWRWIYQSDSTYRLEGQTAYEFLHWSVGESGLALEFATKAAEIYARTTVLHGDISSLDPEQAVVPVLAATDLLATTTADFTLRISLGARH